MMLPTLPLHPYPQNTQLRPTKVFSSELPRGEGSRCELNETIMLYISPKHSMPLETKGNWSYLTLFSSQKHSIGAQQSQKKK